VVDELKIKNHLKATVAIAAIKNVRKKKINK